MKNSHIEWTDHTFNPWEGCTKVSPGCAHCYAEARNQRFSAGANWGPGAPRRRTSPANWKQPLAWNRAAAPYSVEIGKWITPDRPRVFSASLADWLDPEVPIEWLRDFLALIALTPHLDWQLLTKRPEQWRPRLEALSTLEIAGLPGLGLVLAALWLDGQAPANIWIGATTEDQARADERIPQLLAIPARVRFLSCEPLLGPVEIISKIRDVFDAAPLGRDVDLHWVICGGESGPGARPMHPIWARRIREQCEAVEVPFFFKQWGNWLPEHQDINRQRSAPASEIHVFPDSQRTFRMGKLTTGRLLDGLEHNALPSLSLPAKTSP